MRIGQTIKIIITRSIWKMSQFIFLPLAYNIGPWYGLQFILMEAIDI